MFYELFPFMPTGGLLSMNTLSKIH